MITNVGRNSARCGGGCHDPLTPRSSAEWHEVLRASNAFKATLADLRAQTEQNRAYSKAFDERYFAEQESDPDPFPAQGPDGRPIAPSALDPAQDAMLADISRRSVPEPPTPSEEPATARQAERAVLRDAHSNTDKLRRRDPALAWLDDPPPYQSSEARDAPVDPALQWLREGDVEPDRVDGPERDRDR